MGHVKRELSAPIFRYDVENCPAQSQDSSRQTLNVPAKRENTDSRKNPEKNRLTPGGQQILWRQRPIRTSNARQHQETSEPLQPPPAAPLADRDHPSPEKVRDRPSRHMLSQPVTSPTPVNLDLDHRGCQVPASSQLHNEPL